jgi:hypothetical protein
MNDRLNVPNAPGSSTAEPWPAGATQYERHYTCNQVAELWGFHHDTIRRWFEDEPGVVFLGETASRRVGRLYRRKYRTMRIPQSVVDRVYQRLLHKRAAVPADRPPLQARAAAAGGGHVRHI